MELIFEKSVEGKRGYLNPESDVGLGAELPEKYQRRDELKFPEVTELEAVRHFTILSRLNFSVDTNFYPLGSCTMKYNPRINEAAARLPGFADLHPLLAQLPGGEELTQGALEVLREIEVWFCEITGMDAFTLQPLAGAHGELTGVMMMSAYHRSRGNRKKYIIVPDSSHGTNPASAVIAGYETVSIPSDENGVMDLGRLREKITPEVAGLMLTSPNTHGIFNSDIDKIAELVHSVDGIMYYDGANLNAVMGKCRPGDVGFDVVHINTHKTFSTPHGGGGPGSGPVGVTKKLEPFLPVSRVIRREDGTCALKYDYPGSIGYLASFYGSFALLLRAYAYLLMMGRSGLIAVSEHAVLNANYIRERLKGVYKIAYDRICMHECVFSASRQVERGARAIDIAKYLIDRGMHPPTVYFPLTVREAIMIEPTESETKQTMDRFVDAMLEADELARKDPGAFHDLPLTTPVSRPDEARAARELNTNYFARG
jgi:glycine dehydrogenase subunit 2